MNSQNNSICSTPVNGLSSPPSFSRMGDQARRRLFITPGARAAMLPFARELSFDESSELMPTTPMMASTPETNRLGTNDTITITSSPWRPWTTSLSFSQLDSLLPVSPRAGDLFTPGGGLNYNNSIFNSPPLSAPQPMPTEQPSPQPNVPGPEQPPQPPIISFFPTEIEDFLRRNPQQVYTVVVRTTQTFDLYPQN
jgi:hypothetical protein